VYTRAELEAEGLHDFRVFLCHVWAFLGLPRPTKVQLEIAYWLQHGPRRAILQAFRGVGKSWITVAFVLWVLLLDPQKNVEVVSASQGLSDNFSKFCKQLIHGMPLLQHLAAGERQRDSAVEFDVGPARESKDPSVKSAGITGQITGTRADIIIADDVEIPKNSMTHLMRERLAESVKEFDAILKPKEESRIIYLGTPQTEQSLYTRLQDRGYETMVWPAEVPVDISKYRGRLAPSVMKMVTRGLPAGTPIDPSRFSTTELAERRFSYGVAGYALQFMLDTSPSDEDKHPLKLRNCVVMDCDAQIAPILVTWARDNRTLLQDLPPGGFEGDAWYGPMDRSDETSSYGETVMAIDPSGRGKDETAYAIIKYSHGLLYLVAVGGFVDGFGEATLTGLAGVALRWGVNKVIVEENFGGGMFAQLLKPHLAKLKAGSIDEDWKGWSSGMKEHRILDTLEPILASHKLIINRQVIEDDRKVQLEQQAYSFIYQMTRLSRIKGCLPHDDRIDAVAMAAGYFVEKMNRDQQKAVDLHKEAQLDSELAKFKKHVFGVHAPGKTAPGRTYKMFLKRR
jgi:hypothetical protein